MGLRSTNRWYKRNIPLILNTGDKRRPLKKSVWMATEKGLEGSQPRDVHGT